MWRKTAIAGAAAIFSMHARTYCRTDYRVTNLSHISDVATFSTTGDSILYLGEPFLCWCRNDSPYVHSVPYLFGRGINLSNFHVGTCIRKVDGFARIVDENIVFDNSYLGWEFIIKSITYEHFKCGDCMSKRPKRDVITFTLVRSDGKEIILRESELNQNPFFRGWKKK